MSDDTRNSPIRPGLLRSFVHRLAGDAAELPVEGHLPSFDGATSWLNSEPLTPAGPPRPGGPRRLLDLHLHQLAAHAPIPACVGREIRGRRPHRHRRSHARVRLRARHRQRRRAVARLRRRVPDRHRQRLRGVDSVREPLLAGAVHRRCRGPHPVPPFRRRRVRDGRDGGAAVADRSGCGRRRSGSRVRRTPRVRGRGRLGDA